MGYWWCKLINCVICYLDGLVVVLPGQNLKPKRKRKIKKIFKKKNKRNEGTIYGERV